MLSVPRLSLYPLALELCHPDSDTGSLSLLLPGELPTSPAPAALSFSVPNAVPNPPLPPSSPWFPRGNPERFPCTRFRRCCDPLQFRSSSWSRPVRDSSSSAVGLISTQNKRGKQLCPPFPTPYPLPRFRYKTLDTKATGHPHPLRQVWVPGN